MAEHSFSVDQSSAVNTNMPMEGANGPNESKKVAFRMMNKRKRKLTSPIWLYFEMIPVEGDEKKRCKCKKCGQIYIAEGSYGTNNMRRHMRSCGRSDTRDIGQFIINQTTSLSNSTFDVEKFKELLITAVIMHDLPFQFVEWVGVRALLQYVRVDLPVVTRNTCESDCVKLYKRERSKIQTLLDEAVGRISFTSDCWSSLTTDGYICLTAHFIDKEWHLHRSILNFCFMPPPHNGASLSEKLLAFLIDWRIDRKVMSITLDDAFLNDTCVHLLKTQLRQRGGLAYDGKYLHIGCCAHIINLMVQDGLKEIDLAVEKIRESIKYIKGSQERKQKFLECVAHSSLDSKKGLKQDVPTRWSSTFVMLECALYYRTAFMHLVLSDPSYTACPSTIEWNTMEKICKFLGVFYGITSMFSGSKYPTTNLYFPVVFVACLTLRKEMESTDVYMKRMATKMYSKFEKYWIDFSEILAIAVILDPRYKFVFVEWCYKKLYGDVGIHASSVLKEKLFSFYNEYVDVSNTRSDRSMSTSSSSIGANSQVQASFSGKTRDFFMEFDAFENQEFVAQKSQLEKYLEEPRMHRKAELDVLMYWNAKQFYYPEVAAMARDILTISISTVASESAFSVDGRVLDQYKSAMKPEMVEMLICTRNWLYGSQELTKYVLDELTTDVIESNANESETFPENSSSSSVHLDA